MAPGSVVGMHILAVTEVVGKHFAGWAAATPFARRSSEISFRHNYYKKSPVKKEISLKQTEVGIDWSDRCRLHNRAVVDVFYDLLAECTLAGCDSVRREDRQLSENSR